MISFEKPEKIEQAIVLMETIAENMMRPVSRHFDENEHEIPWDYIEFMHNSQKAMGAGSLTDAGPKKKEGPRLSFQRRSPSLTPDQRCLLKYELLRCETAMSGY